MSAGAGCRCHPFSWRAGAEQKRATPHFSRRCSGSHRISSPSHLIARFTSAVVNSMRGCAVPGTMRLYLDDSGTRHPDIHPQPQGRPDWFGLGGVLINEAHKPELDEAHRVLCKRWPITAPLHSYEIRRKTGPFEWIGQRSMDEQQQFFDQLHALVTATPLTGIACVIDRVGYNDLYRGKYRKRWSLCKTAFSVVVERAAKFAMKQGCRLRVYVEESDPVTDRRVKSYFEDMRSKGLPFDPNTSAKYSPLDAAELKRVLFEFRTKPKSSRLMQIADLALWPMCIGGYNPQERSFSGMREAGMLIDCKLDQSEIASCGIKYSCWRNQPAETPKPGP